MYAQRTPLSRSSLRLLFSAICLVLTLVLAGCGANTQNDTSTTRNAGIPTMTTVTQTILPGHTPTPTQGQTTPTTTSTTGPVPFRVTGVSFGSWPGDHTGVCGNHTFFTASVLIYAPAHNVGGTVTYTWLRSDSNTITPSIVTFTAGTTSVVVTSTWSLIPSQGNGSTYTVALKTLSPEVFTTPQITYHHTCQRLVQGINATVAPTSGCSSVTKTFTFSAIVNVSPGANSVTLTYTWKHSNGTSGTTTTASVAQNATTITISESWTLTAPITQGTYWEELSITAPNTFTSHQATFTITNC